MNKRVILFRGKRIDNGHWVYGDYITSFEGSHIIEDDYFKPSNDQHPTLIDIDPKTIGQFTGLLDKEGNKIFEGDIIRTMSGIAVVVWLDAAFALKSPGSEAVDWEHSSVYEQSEILGNIHETPELLNQ